MTQDFPLRTTTTVSPTPFTQTGSQTNRFGDNYDAVTFFVEATRAAGVSIFVDHPVVTHGRMP
jgi:hypothetical protein